jgi:hypothetical protein
VRISALKQLHAALKTHRGDLAKLRYFKYLFFMLFEFSTLTSFDRELGSVVSTLLTSLLQRFSDANIEVTYYFLSISATKSVQVRLAASQCIGELGAIEPEHLQVKANASTPDLFETRSRYILYSMNSAIISFKPPILHNNASFSPNNLPTNYFVYIVVFPRDPGEIAGFGQKNHIKYNFFRPSREIFS